MDRLKLLILLFLCFRGVFFPGGAEPVHAQIPHAQSVSSDTLEEATGLPQGIIDRLKIYAETFRTEDRETFKNSFVDPHPYVQVFEQLCNECFDMQVDYLNITPLADSDETQKKLLIKIQYHLRENRTKKPIRQVSLIEMVFVQRPDTWKILSIRPSERRPAD